MEQQQQKEVAVQDFVVELLDEVAVESICGSGPPGPDFCSWF